MANKKELVIKNADNLIIADEAAKLGKVIPPAATQSEHQETEKAEPELKEAAIAKDKPEEAVQLDEKESAEEGTEEQLKLPIEEPKTEEAQDTSLDANATDVDEYGTKVGKKKTYTEEEVQRMIRERLRERHVDRSASQIQQAAQNFTPDPDSSENWETQLETFVEKTIEKISRKQIESQWQQREEKTQAEFEIKFTEGMTKYNDFQNVVSGKPVTNAMMLATRSMNDPAAFVYAACKTQAKELERISKIEDAVTQAAEIGRLEERMKKARIVSSAPKPAKVISGDTTSESPHLDIDARISQHAKSKMMNFRK